MEHNSRERKYFQRKTVRFVLNLFLIITIIYTFHNLFITKPNILDIIIMQKDMKDIEDKINELAVEKLRLQKELKSLDKDALDMLKKEHGAFEEDELIIIYK